MNLRKTASIVIVGIAILLSVSSVSAQSAFKFKPVVRAGDPAPGSAPGGLHTQFFFQ